MIFYLAYHVIFLFHFDTMLEVYIVTCNPFFGQLNCKFTVKTTDDSYVLGIVDNNLHFVSK